MSELLEKVNRAKAIGDFAELATAIPYLRFSGISASVVDGELRGFMKFDPKLIGNHALPALHGGVIGALLECTAVFELFWRAETVVLPKVINLTVAYLRSGKAEDTWARAIVEKHGRRVVSVRAEAWQSDRLRPIATAVAHFLLSSAPTKE